MDVGARSLKSSRMAERSISSSSLVGVPGADEIGCVVVSFRSLAPRASDGYICCKIRSCSAMTAALLMSVIACVLGRLRRLGTVHCFEMLRSSIDGAISIPAPIAWSISRILSSHLCASRIWSVSTRSLKMNCSSARNS